MGRFLMLYMRQREMIEKQLKIPKGKKWIRDLTRKNQPFKHNLYFKKAKILMFIRFK